MDGPAPDARDLPSGDDEPYAVAVSGGGDSLALLHQAAGGAFGPPPAVAFVVDHGLQLGSRDIALWAAEQAERVDVRARVLTWRASAPRLTGSDPPDGSERLALIHGGGRAAGARPKGAASQAEARMARHTMLAEACAMAGVRRLWLGHTADDQAETVMMRLARDPVSVRGVAGLRARSPSPVWPAGRGLWLERPVLGMRRAELRAVLKDAQAPWWDDPANNDDRFERVRVRALVAGLSTAGFDSLLAVARAGRRLDDRVRAEARRRLSDVVCDGCGRLVVGRAAFAHAPPAVRRAMVGGLIVAASGELSGAKRVQVLGLADALGGDGGFGTQTLGGAMVSPERRGAVVVWSRDPGIVGGRADRAGLGALAAPAGRTVIWDGRFVIAPDDRERVWRPGVNGRPMGDDDRGESGAPGETACGRGDLVRPLGAELLARALG